jgi:predicted O-methyltransferase YrrM
MTTPDIVSKVSTIRSLTGPDHLDWILALCDRAPEGGYFCEIGTYYGRLAAAMALAAPRSKVIVIDEFLARTTDPDPNYLKWIYEEAISNFVALGIWNQIVPIASTSRNAVAAMRLWNPTINLLFIDGDHSEENVFMELSEYHRFIPVGGVLCGDDCTQEEAVRRDFKDAWELGDNTAFMQGPHVPSAVMRFFRNSPSWEAISSPINCFGFRRTS